MKCINKETFRVEQAAFARFLDDNDLVKNRENVKKINDQLQNMLKKCNQVCAATEGNRREKDKMSCVETWVEARVKSS